MSRVRYGNSGNETKTTNVRRRKRGGKAALSSKEAAAVRSIVDNKLAVQEELQYFDTQIDVTSGVDFSSVQTIDLTDIQQGVAEEQRVGRIIQPKSLFLRYKIKAVDATNDIRVILWRQDLNDATIGAGLTNILEYANNGNVDKDIYSPYKIGTKSVKFKILSDRNYALSLNTGDQNQVEEMYFDLSKHPQVTFNEGFNTGANHYQLSYVSDSGAVGHPTIKGWVRFRYTD